MLVLSIVFLCIGLTAAKWPANTCGERPLHAGKVVNGVVAKEGDWPWMCSMLFNGRHICGATLVHQKWVVTAAHCVTDKTASKYVLECGLHHRTNKESWTRSFKVLRVLGHAQYSSSNYRNDIAVMELETSAYIPGKTEWDDYVMPACVPPTGSDYAGKTSYATGWGTLSSGASTLPLPLYQVDLRIWSKTECQAYATMAHPTTQVCAGGPNKDTCQGDSGGPLTVFDDAKNKWQLIGATSWGYGCGQGGVYTQIEYYRSWIESTCGITLIN
ncbi:unnamed protein product [Adineta steineri]|uniref:Peptidase S1 domain-containing protein n=1 Tax=Adineta steineri TaxID=433720 RepID=A0A814VX05_9BILA|nr:unnamed protein product [Adineta steineri]CAF1188593.1 unnamed protein product [Adineta steineri]CAF1194109.1 unnamed protein product [Adineta steineri]